MSKSTQRTEQVPNPGSDEALAQGCRCPVLDNGHGKGILWGGKPSFWITKGCPLHDTTERTESDG